MATLQYGFLLRFSRAVAKAGAGVPGLGKEELSEHGPLAHTGGASESHAVAPSERGSAAAPGNDKNKHLAALSLFS